MVKYLNYVFVSIISVILGTGCTQKIDFENDVPQRAKSISKQQADNVRSSMEVPELKKEYKNYIQQRKVKSLADLEKEKREIEKKIAYVIQADSSKVCAVCRKRLKAASKKSLVVQKGKNAKNTKNKKHKTSQKPSVGKKNGGYVSHPQKNSANKPDLNGQSNSSQFNVPAGPVLQQPLIPQTPPQLPQGPGFNPPFPQPQPQPPFPPQPQLQQPPFQQQPQPPFLPQQPLGFNPPMFQPVPGNQPLLQQVPPPAYSPAQ